MKRKHKQKNVKKIYDAIDFYENYILNYNLYLYDILSQEVFLKLLKTKKNNAIDIILENILNKIKKKYCNKEIIIRIEYIISNSYKINRIFRFVNKFFIIIVKYQYLLLI